MDDLRRLRLKVTDLQLAMERCSIVGGIPLTELAEVWEALKRISSDRYGLQMKELHGEAKSIRYAKMAAEKRADDDLASWGI